jgi:hypothetical protein
LACRKDGTKNIHLEITVDQDPSIANPYPKVLIITLLSNLYPVTPLYT